MTTLTHLPPLTHHRLPHFLPPTPTPPRPTLYLPPPSRADAEKEAMGRFITSQLLDLDHDTSWFPRDIGLQYQEEGEGSIAESLSSLSTNGSEADAADLAAMAAFHGVSMNQSASNTASSKWCNSWGSVCIEYFYKLVFFFGSCESPH